MSISFRVHYKKDKKTVKAIKTLEDFIKKPLKSLKLNLIVSTILFNLKMTPIKWRQSQMKKSIKTT